MWSQYDEDLGQNQFFKEIKENHLDLVQKSCEEDWIICVPRTGTLEDNCEISMDYIFDHILIHGVDDKYCTLSKKQLHVKKNWITIENDKVFNSPVEVLFHETFYIEKSLKYTVWCIDRPLFLKYKFCNSHSTKVLETLHDCIDFLWAESLGHEVLENIQKFCEDFVLEQVDIEEESLQTQKELIGKLYSQCLQISFRNHILKGKTKKHLFLDNLKVAVEAYMQYCLGKKLMYSVNTLQHYSDSTLNKIIRNSKDMHFKDLNIPNKFCDLITVAKCELSKINNYVTVLDKINCLKHCFNVFYETNENISFCITSDDLLQILVFLIIKLNINNWTANLIFMKEFRLSLLDISDQKSYFIATLEAALEFIKSNKFLEIKNYSAINNNSSESNNTYLQNIFNKIGLGAVKTLDLKKLEESSYETLLCHPLCSCDNCEKLIASNDKSVPLDKKIINEKGQNLLIFATTQLDTNVVEFLLRNDCDPNFSDYLGKTALHYAASKGYQDILLLLINYQANVNALDNEKNTPLHLSCENGHENCVKALIYSSAEVEINLCNLLGETPLALATKWGYFDIVKILLENCASVCIKNKRNQSVYSLAPNYYILKLFKNFGLERSKNIANECKINTIPIISDSNLDEKINDSSCKEHGIRPKNVKQCKKIDLLLKAIENNDLPLTCFYLGFNSNSDTQDNIESKCHPLCCCEKCQNDYEFEVFREEKHAEHFNINTCDVNGYTPLHVAAKFGRTEILRLLLDCGALLNVQTYKTLSTPLHLAVNNQRIHVVRELLKCGNCDIDPQDVKGNTPLYFACLKNDVRIIEVLLINGADCCKKNYEGRSALQEVEDKNQYRVFKLLKESLKTTFDKDIDKSTIANDDESLF